MQTMQAITTSSLAVLPKPTEAQRDAELLIKSFGAGKQVATQVLCEDLDIGATLDANDRDTIVYLAMKGILERTFDQYPKADGPAINDLIHTWDTTLAVLREWCGDNDKVRNYAPVKYAFERFVTSEAQVNILENLLKGMDTPSKPIYEPRELGYQLLNDIKGKLASSPEVPIRECTDNDLERMLRNCMYQGQQQTKDFVVGELGILDISPEQKSMLVYDILRNLTADTVEAKGRISNDALKSWDSAFALVEHLRNREDVVPGIGKIFATALRVGTNYDYHNFAYLDSVFRRLRSPQFRAFGAGIVAILRQESKAAA